MDIKIEKKFFDKILKYLSIIVFTMLICWVVWYGSTHNVPEVKAGSPGRFEILYEQIEKDDKKIVKFFIFKDSKTNQKYLYVWSYKSAGLTKLEDYEN